MVRINQVLVLSGLAWSVGYVIFGFLMGSFCFIRGFQITVGSENILLART